MTQNKKRIIYVNEDILDLVPAYLAGRAKDIIARVSDLGKHLKSYEDYHNKLGNNLKTVVNQYVLSSKELKKVDKDVVRITGSGTGMDPLVIEKPDEE